MTSKTAKGKTEGEDKPARAVARVLFPSAAADNRAQAKVIGAAQRTGQAVEVILAHHWTDPATGENYEPEDAVTVDGDTAAGLAGAALLVRGSKAVIAGTVADGEKLATEGATKDGKDTGGK